MSANQAKREHDFDSGAYEAEIARAALLPDLQYQIERKPIAKRLNIPLSALDRLVKAKRPEQTDDKQGRAISFPEPELWFEAVDGATLLDSIAGAAGQHVIMPDYSRDTAALWVVHSYLIDCSLVSPRLAIHSPVKRCGKTTLLDVLGRLVLRPLPTANVTASAMFRVVEAYRPALLVDEADTFLRDNDELRGIINSGHRLGGSVLRTVDDDHEPRSFSTYSACAIALIGKLPETLQDRSVLISLKRRLPSEQIMPFRPDRADHLDLLARKAMRWTKDNAGRIVEADPEMPDGIYNREADNWRPLLAIADVAGGHWPDRARQAVAQSRNDGDDDSRLVILLADIKGTYGERETDRLASSDITEALNRIEGRPWAEYGRTGKPLSQNQLARLLKPLGIMPENIRVGDRVPKGYLLNHFTEAFDRYLSAEGASEPLRRYKPTAAGTSTTSQTATPESDVADRKCEKPAPNGPCSGVAVEKGDRSDFPLVCMHCGAPAGPDSPIQLCAVDGQELFLHCHCQADWLLRIPDDLSIPAFMKREPGS